MKIKFNLKWLLLLLTICAVVAWWFSKAGMAVAHVRIIDNQLEMNEQGTIDGHLQCRLAEANDYSYEYCDFVCRIYHVNHKHLLTLKKNHQARIEYRRRPVWPFKKADDPYRIFLNRDLGIPDTEILGADFREGWTQFVIRGGDSPGGN